MLSVFPTHSYLDDDFNGEKNSENQIRLVDNICILCKHNNQSLRGDKLQNSSKDSLSFNNLEITCIAEEGLSKTMKPQLRTIRNNTKLSNNLLPVISIIKRRNLFKKQNICIKTLTDNCFETVTAYKNVPVFFRKYVK